MARQTETATAARNRENGQSYRIEFDGVVEMTLAELVEQGFFYNDDDEKTWDGWSDFTRDDIALLEVSEHRLFGGGAAPVGTITRLA